MGEGVMFELLTVYAAIGVLWGAGVALYGWYREVTAPTWAAFVKNVALWPIEAWRAVRTRAQS
jgi:hypothetical protein